MISLRQYLFSVLNSHGLTRTLGDLELCRDADGRPCYSVGNSAAVFKIRYRGEACALRCYMRRCPHLEAIYGDRLLRRELFVYRDGSSGEWTDVVLDRWREGATLQERIVLADRAEFIRLAAAFDRLAARMTADDRAHGDLKPENLVVGSDGELYPIDFDAAFLPAFAGEESSELGTAAFQHPARTRAHFDARIDDFPAALIATALHALAIDPTLRTRHHIHETLLVDPQRLPDDPALGEILALFEREGMAVEYRIARLLFSPTPALAGVSTLLALAAERRTRTCPAPPPVRTPDLFVERGLWGFRDPVTGLTVIPPLYDNGFDFTEGLAAVRLGNTWHFIDPTGRTVLRCPGFDAVKPFRGESTEARRGKRRYRIDRDGTVTELEY